MKLDEEQPEWFEEHWGRSPRFVSGWWILPMLLVGVGFWIGMAYALFHIFASIGTGGGL